MHGRKINKVGWAQKKKKGEIGLVCDWTWVERVVLAGGKGWSVVSGQRQGTVCTKRLDQIHNEGLLCE